MTRRRLLNEIKTANQFFRDGDYTRAYNLLHACENMKPDMRQQYRIAILKIQCLLRVGNINEAESKVLAYIDRFPLNPRFNIMAAGFFHETGSVDRANRLYLRAICLEPNSVQFALTYAHFLCEHNRNEDALGVLIRTYRNARKKISKDDSRIYFLILEIANIYYDTGKYLRALIFLQHASEMHRDFPCYDLMAECYLYLKNYHEALYCIENHMKQWGPNDPDTIFIYSKCLAGAGRNAEALANLNNCRLFWGELVLTAADIRHLYPLLQDGSLQKMPDVNFRL